MAQRRFHYEQAFEHYLRANRVPYVAVDEAKKSLMPLTSSRLSAGCLSEDQAESREPRAVAALPGAAGAIKSFDFVVYAPGRNLLVDVKGRMYGRPTTSKRSSSITRRRFESWVTDEDVEGLTQWQALFGDAFQATFVFAYCLRQQPPDALFEEVFTYGNRWYALREVPLESYRRVMQRRSKSWGTLHVPAEDFARISRPFSIRHEPGADSSRRRLAG